MLANITLAPPMAVATGGVTLGETLVRLAEHSPHLAVVDRGPIYDEVVTPARFMQRHAALIEEPAEYVDLERGRAPNPTEAVGRIRLPGVAGSGGMLYVLWLPTWLSAGKPYRLEGTLPIDEAETLELWPKGRRTVPTWG